METGSAVQYQALAVPEEMQAKISATYHMRQDIIVRMSQTFLLNLRECRKKIERNIIKTAANENTFSVTFMALSSLSESMK